MAISAQDLEQIRQYLIANGRDVTDLPLQTSYLDTITLPAVNTETKSLVKIPVTSIMEHVDSVVGDYVDGQNLASAQKALRAAAGAAKAQKDLQDAMVSIDSRMEAITELLEKYDAGDIEPLVWEN